MYKFLLNDMKAIDANTSRFLNEASLRYECFSLLHRKPLNDWEKARLAELVECPACQISWFVQVIEAKSHVLKENNINRLE